MYDYGEMIVDASIYDYPFYDEQCNVLSTPAFDFVPIPIKTNQSISNADTINFLSW